MVKAISGLLVVMDGGKVLRAAVKKAVKNKAIVQRCQWLKREDLVTYLLKSKQENLSRVIQPAQKKPGIKR